MSHSALSSISITGETAMFTDVAVLYFALVTSVSTRRKGRGYITVMSRHCYELSRYELSWL